MKDDDATQLLRILAEAFPAFPLGADGAEMWAAVLRAAEIEDGYEAVVGWVEDEDRFPTVHQLRDRLAAAASTRRAIEQGQLIETEPEQSSRVGVLARAQKAALAKAGPAPHDHTDGLKSCSTCSAPGVWTAKVAQLFREELAREGGVESDVTPPTYRCRECREGRSWVAEPSGLRPCKSCAFPRWVMWDHRRDGHGMCDACATPKARKKLVEVSIVEATKKPEPMEAF